MPKPSKHHQQAGHIGGLVSRGQRTNEDHRKERAAEGRMRRYLDQVPDHVTDPVERSKCAELLQRAHMSRIAKTSADRRRKPGKAA
jgi:hypothetical protein